jgi:phospholipid/cholesterol/gamma-HCH transport system substrate-binding protein
MAKRQARFLTGLFVIVGVLIGVVAVVWLGASKYFEKGSMYVTYFDESVQGLQVDSEVKYRGVGVGNVKSIGVAPDQRLVEVVIKIALEGDVEHTIVSQLRAAGITGIVFVELDRRKPDEQVFLPPERIKIGYTVIPSKPSQTKQIVSGIDQLIERVSQVDLKGLSDQLKSTSRAMETFVAGPEMKNILKNLDSTTATLESGLRRIDGILAEGSIQGILEETQRGLEEARRGVGEARQGVGETRQGLGEVRQGIAETRDLIATVKAEIVNMKAAELAGKADRFVVGLDRRTRRMASDIESTTDDIRQAVEHLRALLDRLQQNPSDLIYSKPAGDGGEEGER